MKPRVLLAPLLAALAAASLLVAMDHPQRRVERRAAAAGTLRIETSLTPVLKIYVNGKLVHSGVDPATRNFLKLLAYLLASTYPFQVVDTNGNAFTVRGNCSLPAFARYDGSASTCILYHDYNFSAPILPSASIAFGTGTQPFTRDVYKLANEIDSGLASYAEGYNATHSWFALTRSLSVGTSITITEVGLKVLAYDGSKYRWVLLLYTPVNVALNPGDNLTVSYVFYFQGLSKNIFEFWKVFSLTPVWYNRDVNSSLNYPWVYFANMTDEDGKWWRVATGNYTTPLPLVYPHWRCYKVTDAVIIELGTGTSPPSASDYKLQSKIAEGRAGVGAVLDDGRIIFATTIVPPSDFTVTEVGVAIIANDMEGYAAAYCDIRFPDFHRFLILRALLPKPVALKGGKPVVVAWTIKLP